MPNINRLRTASVIAMTAFVLLAGRPADAQLAVFDPANYAKNVINEIHMVQQLATTAEQAQTALAQLKDLKTFTAGQWSDAKNNLLALAQVVEQNKNLSYNDSNLAEVFNKAYPLYQSPANFQELSKTWYNNTKSSILNALQVAGMTTKQFSKTDEILQDAALKTENPASQSALVQVGNRIAGLTVEQLQKLQQLEVARQGYETSYYAGQANDKSSEAPLIATWLGSAVSSSKP